MIRGTINLNKLKKDGLVVGSNFHAQDGVIIDPGHCWLINIGDNVTLAPRVHILAHDASTKTPLGYTKIGMVTIGNNVFIGAGTIVLPGVGISDNTIVGAGSVVTKSLQSGIYGGNPCVLISSYEEYLNKQVAKIANSPVYDSSHTIGQITIDEKQEMRNDMEKSKSGFIV